MVREHSIYIILTRTNTMFAKTIRFISKDTFSHASICLDINKDKMYSFGRKSYYNVFNTGFIEETTTTNVFGKHNELPCVILEMKVTEEEYNNIKNTIEDFKSKDKLYRYNYIGLISNRLNKTYFNDHRFFCSEFVYHILESNLQLECNLSRTFIKPETFFTFKECEVIYKGDLKRVFT